MSNNQNIDSLSKETEGIKLSNGNFTTEKYNNQNCKTSRDGLTNRIKRTKEMISEQEYKTIEMIQCEQWRKWTGKR
jgi:hypothetical protein